MAATSNFTGFDLTVDNDDGSASPVPSQTVKVRDVTNGDDLPDLTTDGDGHVDGGTLEVDVGTFIRFRVENDGFGRSGYEEQVTT